MAKIRDVLAYEVLGLLSLSLFRRKGVD